MLKKPEFTFDMYTGSDNVPVVHVQTPEGWDTLYGPKCRIYLNDSLIYAGEQFIHDLPSKDNEDLRLHGVIHHENN
jgi:hypothetical protein